MEYIKQNFATLSKTLVLNELIGHLYTDSLLSVYDYELLEQCSTRHARNQMFMLNLQMYGERVQARFLQFLEREQPNDANCMDHNAIVIYDKNKQWVTSKCVELKKCLNPYIMAPILYQRDYITVDEMEILHTLTTRARASRLVAIIIQKANRPGMLDYFLNALKKHQRELFDRVCV